MVLSLLSMALAAPAHAAGAIDLSPTSLDFGHVFVGSTSQQYIIVRNVGDEPLAIVRSTVRAPITVDDWLCRMNTVPPNGTCPIFVGFSPGNEAPVVETLLIENSDPAAFTVAVSVRGFSSFPRLGVLILGPGRVVSDPFGIDCPPTCTGLFSGQSVALTPAPPDGTRFVRWSGGCNGDRGCAIPVSENSFVIAEFAPISLIHLAS